MAKIETYSCDVCQIQKQASNHWWKAFLLSDADGKNIGSVVLEWSSDEISMPKSIGGGFVPERAHAHLCGSKCLMEWISKNVLEGKS